MLIIKVRKFRDVFIFMTIISFKFKHKPTFRTFVGVQCRTVSCRSTFLLGDEVLDYDISHAVSVGVAVLIEPVHCAEYQLEEGYSAILTTHHLQIRKAKKKNQGSYNKNRSMNYYELFYNYNM